MAGIHDVQKVCAIVKVGTILNLKNLAAWVYSGAGERAILDGRFYSNIYCYLLKSGFSSFSDVLW